MSALLRVLLSTPAAASTLEPAIAIVSSRVIYRTDEQNVHLMMGDRRTDYLLVKMRFDEDLLVSFCPYATAYGCTKGNCGCLMCPQGFQLNFNSKPLTCASSSPFFETAPSPEVIPADTSCEGGAVPIKDAMSFWNVAGQTVFPLRLPAVSCPNIPHVQVHPIISTWDEPVYLLLKMQNACLSGRDSLACAEITNKVYTASNSRVVNLAVVGPSLDEFIRDCEIIPNVFSATTGTLAAPFAASDSEKLKIRPPVCDKNLFDAVASLMQAGTTDFMRISSCVDESNYLARPAPNPCVEGGACPEVWEGMGCQHMRAVVESKLLGLLDETMLWTSLDAFAGCVSLADSLVAWNKSQDTILSDRCAWKSWERQFFSDPCCNGGLMSCCRDSERQVSVRKAAAVNTQRVAEVCAADTSGQAMFARRALAAVARYQKTSEESSDVCMEQLEELRNVKTDVVAQCRQLLQGHGKALTADERFAKTEECVRKILGPELGAQVFSRFTGDSRVSARCEGDEVWQLVQDGAAITKDRCEAKKRCNWNPLLNETACVKSRRTDFDHFCRRKYKDFTGEEISVQPGCSIDLSFVASACEAGKLEDEMKWHDVEVQQKYQYDWFAFQQDLMQTFIVCMDKICKAQGGTDWISEGGGNGRCRDTTKRTQEQCDAAGHRWIEGAFASQAECEAEVCSSDESITDPALCVKQELGCDRPCLKCAGGKSVCVDESVASAVVCRVERDGLWECSEDGGHCVCVLDKDSRACGLAHSNEQFLSCDKFTKNNECWLNPWNFLLQCHVAFENCASREECEAQGECSDSWIMPTDSGCLMDRQTDQYSGGWGFCNSRLSDRIDELLVDSDTDGSVSFFSTRDWSMQDTGTALGCSLQPVYPQQQDFVPMQSHPVDFSSSVPFLRTVGFNIPKSTCSSCGCRNCLNGQSDGAVRQCLSNWMLGEFPSCKADVSLCIPEFFAHLGMFDEQFSSNVMCDQKCSAEVAVCMINAVDLYCSGCDASCRPSPCFNPDGTVKDDPECQRVVNTALFVNRNGNPAKPAMCTAEAWKADCIACGGGLGCNDGDQETKKLMEGHCILCSAEFFFTNYNTAGGAGTFDPASVRSSACMVCVAGRNDEHLGQVVGDRKRTIVGMDGLLQDSAVLTVDSLCESVLAVAQACDVHSLANAPSRVGSICLDSFDEAKFSDGVKQDIIACVAAASAAGHKKLPSTGTIETCTDSSLPTSIPNQLATLLFARKQIICDGWVSVAASSHSDSLMMHWINDDMLAKAQASEVCKTNAKTLMAACTETAQLTVGDLCGVPADDTLAATAKLTDELKLCKVPTLCAKAIVRQVAAVFMSDRVFICQAMLSQPEVTGEGPSPFRNSGVAATPQVQSKSARWFGLGSPQVSGRKLSEARESFPATLVSSPELPAWRVLLSSEGLARRLQAAVRALDDAICTEPEQLRGFFENDTCLYAAVLSLDISSVQCAVLQRLVVDSQIDDAADELMLLAGCPATSEQPAPTTGRAPLEGRSKMVAAVWRQLQEELASVAAAWKTTVTASLAQCQPESACLDKYADQIVAVVSQTVTRETVTLADFALWALQVGAESWDRSAIDKTLTEARCASLGGRWYSKAQSKEECLSGKGSSCCRKRPLEDGSCPWGFYTEETEATCGSCKSGDATMTPNLQWLNGGVWQRRDVAMAKRGEWVRREYAPVNRWVVDAINWDKLAFAFETALADKTAQTYQDYARCRLTGVTSALSDVAGFCGVGNLEFLTVSASAATQDVPKTKMAERTVVPGVASTVGSTRTHLRVHEGAFRRSAVMEMSITDVEEFKGGVFSPRGPQSAGQRLQMSTAMASTASCYTVVTNADNVLVGQLVGSCVHLEATQQPSAVNVLTLCLPIDPEIPVHADFTVTDFAEYDATKKKFTPIATSGVNTSTSSQQCQTVTQFGIYCPIKRVDMWMTAAVSADASCDSLDTVLAEIHSAQQDLGFVTDSAYVSVSHQDGLSGASFDATVQAARDVTLRLDCEPVNHPNDVSGGSIQFKTDQELNREYGLTLAPTDDDAGNAGKSAACDNGALLAVLGVLAISLVL